MSRIRYSSEIRETTVRRILDGQVSRTDAAREIGCSLYREQSLKVSLHPSPESRIFKYLSIFVPHFQSSHSICCVAWLGIPTPLFITTST
ncbi:MAG: hypothetical protein LBT05_09505, partial [Planctomycetaceae bacterium]|nr:hypothetical protein [Planctomycetaceae bacterium]